MSLFLKLLISNPSCVFSVQHSKTSIILDASKYIEDLKRKIDVMIQDIDAARDSDAHASLPNMVESRT